MIYCHSNSTDISPPGCSLLIKIFCYKRWVGCNGPVLLSNEFSINGRLLRRKSFGLHSQRELHEPKHFYILRFLNNFHYSY